MSTRARPALFHDEALRILRSLADGMMSSIAYDTAWFVRLRTPTGGLRYPRAAEWLYRHQHADGSFGGMAPVAHDRMVSTLAALTALAPLSADSRAARAVQAGLAYVARAAGTVAEDPHETVGFELLLPRLAAEARDFGLPVPVETFSAVERMREEKLRLVPPGWQYAPDSPLAHNLEYLGPDLTVEAAIPLTASNGSVANSPSASAYLALHTRWPALDGYLDATARTSPDGGIPNVRPFEVFETAWVLRNLLWAGMRPAEMGGAFRRLSRAFGPGGVGISASGLRPDADDGAMAAAVLKQAGLLSGYSFLKAYERPGGYVCFPYERNGSVSTNIHILDLVAEDPAPEAALIRERAVSFLGRARGDAPYWTDKWHVSPYYPTSHAILAFFAAGRGADVQPAVRWLLETQRADGSWGAFSGSREETAYALQALAVAGSPDRRSIQSALGRGLDALEQRAGASDPELWIGKGLYAPTLVIEATVLSAQVMARARLVDRRGVSP